MPVNYLDDSLINLTPNMVRSIRMVSPNVQGSVVRSNLHSSRVQQVYPSSIPQVYSSRVQQTQGATPMRVINRQSGGATIFSALRQNPHVLVPSSGGRSAQRLLYYAGDQPQRVVRQQPINQKV